MPKWFHSPMVMDALFVNYIAVSQRLGLSFEHGRTHGTLDGIALQMSFGTYAVFIAALLPNTAPVDVSIATKTLIGSSEISSAVTRARSVTLRSTRCSRSRPRTSHGSPRSSARRRDARSSISERRDCTHRSNAHAVHLRRFSASAIDDSQQTIERDLREATRLARVIGDSFRAATPAP